MVEVAAPIDEATTDAAGDGAAAPFDAGRRRYILTLLMIAYTLSYLDRQVLSILVEPIERELHIKDAQMGLLTGPIFVIFYTFLGIPIARIADRRSRPAIIAVSLTVWSAFTALSGWASGFAVLALARLGVGFGEAGCNPSSHSLIADISTRQQRASGLAFYSLGVPFGTMLGSSLGGVLADLYGWRTAFLVAGVPGLILAAVVAVTVREPRKAPAPGAPGFGKAVSDFVDLFRELTHKPTFWLVAVSAGFLAFVGYGHLFFLQAFFLRNHGPQLAAIAAHFGLKPTSFLGIATGLVTGAGGFCGTMLGGVVADRVTLRHRRAHMTVPALGAIITVPVLLGVFTVGDPLVGIGLYFVANLVGSFWYAPFYATAQSVVQPHHRATSAALLLLILNLIGLGLGPTFVGALSEFLATHQHLGKAEGLRWAMIVTAFVSLVSVVLLMFARRTVREDVVS